MVVFLGILAIICSVYLFIKNKRLLEKNSYLKKQIHHRVKNNVQVAYSLINLQKRYLTDAKSSRELEDTQKRVAALCYVNKLFLTKNMDNKTVSSDLFNEKCINFIFKKHFEDEQLIGVLAKPLSSEYKFKNIDLDRALPLSLLINEFLLVFFNDKILSDKFCNFFTCLNKGEFIISLPIHYEKSFLEGINKPLHYRIINRLAQQLGVHIKINNTILTQQV